MRSYQLDSSSGARLVGGEMLQWSDVRRDVGPGVSSLVVRRLVHDLEPSSRVLLVGPRAAAMGGDLPDGADVDLLVRSLPDARRLASTAALRSGVTVYCGSVDRYDPAVPYDLIVTLDQPPLLVSPDSPGLGHRETVQQLAKWMASDGTLVTVLQNDLGFDRLFGLHPRPLAGDDAWDVGAPGFDARPLNHHEVAGALESAGLQAAAQYAAFPSPDHVSMLVGTECLDDPALTQTASALVARAEASHFSTRPAMTDPYSLVLRVFESREVLPLASAWLVVAQPAAARVDRSGLARGSGGLPVLVGGEESGRAQWRVLRTIEGGDGRWRHTAKPVVAAREMREGHVVRVYDGQPEGIPAGPTLEAVLRRACEAHDMSTIRHLVRRYAAWLAAPPPAEADADPRFFAIPSNVVVADVDFTLFDPSWGLVRRLRDEVLLTRGLRDFALRLLRSGAEHPWAPDISADRLAGTLVAMTGVDLDSATIEAVARQEAEVDVVLNGGDALAESQAYADNLDAGRAPFALQSGATRGFREVLTMSGRLTQALHERSNKVEWLELTLRARDRRVADLERQLASVQTSASFKIGRFLTWPARAVVRLARRVVLSAIPHGYVDRAWRLARRLATRV